MIEVTIRGKNFPLCLTVAALDKINSKCGGLGGLSNFLRGGGDFSTCICNLSWMLGLLIQEGEENRLVSARFNGEKVDRRAVPDGDAVAHLMTIREMGRYTAAVWEAVNESVAQEIEAEHEKNVGSAERV